MRTIHSNKQADTIAPHVKWRCRIVFRQTLFLPLLWSSHTLKILLYIHVCMHSCVILLYIPLPSIYLYVLLLARHRPKSEGKELVSFFSVRLAFGFFKWQPVQVQYLPRGLSSEGGLFQLVRYTQGQTAWLCVSYVGGKVWWCPSIRERLCVSIRVFIRRLVCTPVLQSLSPWL